MADHGTAPPGLPRRLGARRVAPAEEASPRLIEPIINRYKHDAEEFTKFLEGYFLDGDNVLHLGCQDGAITFRISQLVAPMGHVVGVSSPGRNTRRAKGIAKAQVLEDIVTFFDVQDLTALPFQDDTFDIVYASNIMALLPPHPQNEIVIKVLTEMKRVARPGGLVASRDLAAQHFFPTQDLIDIIPRTLFKASGLRGWYGPIMPQLYSRAGLDTYTMTCSTSLPQGTGTGDSDWAQELMAPFGRETKLRARWIAAGVQEAILNLISIKLRHWGLLSHSWYVCLYTEIVAQKDNPAGFKFLDPDLLDPDTPVSDAPDPDLLDPDTPVSDAPDPDPSDSDPPISGSPVLNLVVSSPPVFNLVVSSPPDDPPDPNPPNPNRQESASMDTYTSDYSDMIIAEYSESNS
ncbi:S-adenosyl-L-methionine-dependent methyltransferase [Xylaria longipes]|nr:S-adenosyl-L-methionine-dependent methyltransferase [Xylaria longipes]